MMVELSGELVEELRVTLGDVISDMSSEIADTDNAAYRRGLQARRQRLKSIVESCAPLAPVVGASASSDVSAPEAT